MDKLKMHSPDLTQDNITRIRDLFPNCVTEAKDENGKLKLAVDFDLLKQELTDSIVEGPQERYHLNWPGKREAMLAANAPIAKTLRPCREESVDFDTTKNLFIEGDNLEALKLLQETYLGKVKMIYIDPPYNTGNDFIYEDDFAENTEVFLKRSNQKDEYGNKLVTNTMANGRFHSDWLSMLYPRIKLAKSLLKDDGVIFISIDDHEQANLKRLCDEVFGSDALVGIFPWRSRTAKADVPYGVSNDVEWVIAYAKPCFIAGRLGERNYYKTDDYEDRWRLQDLTTNKTATERPNSFFTMLNPKSGEMYPASENRTWSVTKETFDDYYKKGKIVFPDDYDFLKLKKPAFRVFEQEDKAKAIIKYGTDTIRMSVSTYLPEKEIGRTEHGSKEIRDYFNSQLFQYPKPTSLIKFFVNILCDSDALIFDFFCGSATTAEAVMRLNSEDGGNRKFIMVQLPEMCNEKSEAYKSGYKTIADISRERIRRAGKKIKEELISKSNVDQTSLLEDQSGSPDATKLDIGFRVLKIDTSNMAEIYYTPDAIQPNDLFTSVDNIKPERTPEDLLFQVLLDWGVDLTLPIRKQMIQDKTIFFVDENALIACFDSGVTEELVKELTSYKPLRIVFKDNSFTSDSVKINVDQIFKQLSPITEVRSI
ncbi:site-specific DNA-methyltransferase [Chitinispirillales bacterium ANBcel5]|uniref:site-specific DNA-methyltransferase n=1 Tax=Cellulosispirillum alkaliphilum TaxID=3039283 RepID=UPI002A538B15|nr:site-specific DNA-methyltransferase [Chitinispirillales bacterium ANBcel5]